MSNILMFTQAAVRTLDMETETLPAIPKERLFKKYMDYRRNVEANYSNIDYLLYGEALIEEIGIRKYTREFEESISNHQSQVFNINY